MAEKTVAQKLLIKPGQRVLLVNAPANTPELLGPLPDGARLVTGEQQGANAALLFAHHSADLERLLPALHAAVDKNAIIWVAYHKGTSLVKTDINRDSIWRYAKTVGFDAVAMISVDEDWSAMRLKIISAGA